MPLREKFCSLCATELEVFYSSENLDEELSCEMKNLKFAIDGVFLMCNYCYAFLLKIQKFRSQFIKTQQFLTRLENINDEDFQEINDTKNQLEIEDIYNNKSTDTSDIEDNLNCEIIVNDKTSNNDCCDDEDTINIEHSFQELEDFSEIPTITITDQHFVVQDPEIESQQKIIIETEMSSCNEMKIESNSKLEDLNFSCHVCSENFNDFFGLHVHTRKEHDSLPQVACVCGETLNSRTDINFHKKLHTLDKSYACQSCNKIYTHQQSLQNHIKKMHTDDVNKLQCSKCSKKFQSERKLKHHEQIHLPNDKKQLFPCPYPECNKSFTKSINVQAHVKSIHHKQRDSQCDVCGKVCSTKGALKEHQITHSDQYPFACKFCFKKFKNLPRLKTHEDIHSITQYICNVCGISLNTKRTLKMHMVVHSDQKKFKCQYCGSCFKRSKALKNHLILHSGLRPYSCMFCDKTFANGSNCRSHKKKAHPTELAAFEASGKITPSPNIPRLDLLQTHQLTTSKTSQVVIINEPNMILQEISSNDIKGEFSEMISQT